MGCKHLTPKERESILCLQTQGFSVRTIAKKLERSPSTISRELKRNSVDGAYSAFQADKLYRKRRERCRPLLKLEDNELWQRIHDDLRKGWSPEQILGREPLGVSVTTVYRAFKSGLLPTEAKQYLRRKGKPYKRRGCQETRGHLKDTVPIELRPKEVQERGRIGDWELDTVLGKPGSGGIITVVDRSSRFLKAVKIKDKTATSVEAALIHLLQDVECLTLTADNGKEFAKHKEISAALGTPMYFAHPHSPWERGTNENTNGLIREYLPKGLDFRGVKNEDVLKVVDRLNNRPRKCLGFRTPKEVFLKSRCCF